MSHDSWQRRPDELENAANVPCWSNNLLTDFPNVVLQHFNN